MNKYYLMKLIGFALFLTACQTPEVEYYTTENIESKTKSGAPDFNSETNPELINDWESLKKIILNNGQETSTPWFFDQGNSINIPKGFALDVKKEDGWKLIFHTLIKKNLAEPNYIIFYNQNRGTLKAFYYNDQAILTQKFIWSLKPLDYQNRNISSNRRYEEVLNSNIFDKFCTTTNITEDDPATLGSLSRGWNAFEFELNYAGEGKSGSIFDISGYASQQLAIKLKGSYSGNVIIPSGYKEQSNWFGKLTSIIADFSSAFSIVPDVLKKFINNDAEKNPNNANFFMKLDKSKGYLSSISSVMGKVNGFFNKEKTPVYINATSKGNITLDGVAEATLGGAVYVLRDINIKSLNNPNIDLGLWNLKEEPILKVSRYSNLFSDTDKSPYSSHNEFYSHNLELDGDFNKIRPQIINSIVVNPQIKEKIESTDIDLFFWSSEPIMNTPIRQEMVGSENWLLKMKLNTDLYNWSYFSTNGYYYNENISGGITRREFILDRASLFFRNTAGAYKYRYGALFVNISITFKYKNGTYFLSSKNFKVKLEMDKDNTWANTYFMKPKNNDNRLFFTYGF